MCISTCHSPTPYAEYLESYSEFSKETLNSNKTNFQLKEPGLPGKTDPSTGKGRGT